MARLTQITPFVLCSALDQQITFYTECLGFTVEFRQDNYAFLRRDDVAVRLIEIEADKKGTPAGDDQSFYIDVEDVDALYAELEPALSALPKGRVRAPFDQPYGQREFHVLDEDGALVFFGEALVR